MTLHTVVQTTEAENTFYRTCVPGDLNPFAPRDTCTLHITGMLYCTREHNHADRCVSSTDTTVVAVAT